MKKVSIVILNWNGEKLLAEFLPSVIRYSSAPDVEIVVADNNSTDDSRNLISTNFPQIKIISLPENYGYAKGYNEALKQIDAEYAVLLNSDVEVTENWLDILLSFMEENKNVAAVQPKILSYRNREYFEYAGASGGYIDKYGYPFCRGRIFDTIEKDYGQYDDIRDVFWTSGACMMIRLSKFVEAGMFDSCFFAHMEEIDLCWRLNLLKNRLVCLPQSVVYHVGAATLNSDSPQKTFLNFRNNLLMLYKNLPEKELNRVLKVRLLLDYVAALKMLLSGKAKNATAILKAHKEFNKMKKEYSSHGNKSDFNEDNNTLTTIYDHSILYAYYFQKKKVFSKLRLNK
ncbi:MAG: glycosyltransferase [Dysgonomonas sp.]